ncbi:23S rRNA (uracil(1939)-C(5))-methyltransferase RlmD [Desulfuromonas thiophila]|uniref:23S rRNA (uracil(1939)-C(5))-methyltransferase RlmD n=1 Tax=Desulfuromonas thiophila TaxID=57664 RepID=UPI0024A875FF|nr:23S rRNA (uracil(1939)-C(5))-methyltransferase RlmD [Desulfuromonas thiophila]
MAQTRPNKRIPRRPAQPPRRITIESLNGDGLGVVREDGKELLVAGVLPGEEVIVRVEHEGQHRRSALLLKVTRPHADRVAPPCPRFPRCPGCPLLHLSYAAQCDFKTDQLRQALALYPELAGRAIAPLWQAPEPLGYRTTAKLALAKVQGKALVGLYQRGSHRVIDIGDCPQQHPLINRIAQALREEIEHQKLHVYNPISQRGLLRYLAVRVSPLHNRALVTLVGTERNLRDFTHLAKWLQKKVPEIIGVHLNINPSSGNVVFSNNNLRLLGVDSLFDQIGDVRLQLSPTSFFQVNHAQAARIYRQIADWAGLTEGKTALDLYGGVGGIALHLARRGGQVIGIEINPQACDNARAAASHNRLSNCRFINADAAEAAADLVTEGQVIDVAVVNPPRSGCDTAVLEALGQLRPAQLIYLSCHPHSLARDLHQLLAQGYTLDCLQPIDMFPQTPHVETLVRLRLQP